MLIIRNLIRLFALVIVAAAISACAKEEQNRLLSYEKGTYLGKADQSLTSEQVRKLMTRADIQRVY